MLSCTIQFYSVLYDTLLYTITMISDTILKHTKIKVRDEPWGLSVEGSL